MEDKFYCVIAMFDEETNEKFGVIKNNFRLNGIEAADIQPHITLGAYVDIEEEKLCNWIEELCNENKSFPINFNHFGLFPLDVLFLAPQVSSELTNFHKALHEKYEDYCGEIGFNYTVKSKNWVPHATVLISQPEVLLKALPIASDSFKPFIGQITSVGIYEFYPMREVKVFNLR